MRIARETALFYLCGASEGYVPLRSGVAAWFERFTIYNYISLSRIFGDACLRKKYRTKGGLAKIRKLWGCGVCRMIRQRARELAKR